MKLLSTFLLMFLAVSGGMGDHSVEKRGLFDGIGGLVTDLFGNLTKLITGVIADIKAVAGAVVTGVNDVVNALTADIKAIAKYSHEFLHNVVGTFAKRWDVIKDKIVRPAIDEFNKVLAMIEAELSEAITASQNKVDSMIAVFNSKVKEVTFEGFNAITELVQRLSDKISKSATALKKCVNEYIPKLEEFAKEQTANFKKCINDNVDSVKAEVAKFNTGIQKATGEVKKIADDADACLKPVVKDGPGFETLKAALSCLTKVKDAAIVSSVESAKELIELSEGVVSNIALAVKNIGICESDVVKQTTAGIFKLESDFDSCCKSL